MRSVVLIVLLSILISCNISDPDTDQEYDSNQSLLKDKKAKVTVCHKTNNGNFNKIEVSESALPAHLNHGDAKPGDVVPGNEGYYFNEECDCVKRCPATVHYAGKTYNTVEIGEQCWLKENLNVGEIITSNSSSDNQTDNGKIEKYCYDNDENNCDTYGGLYQWNEAMQYLTTEGTQGICPSGWHIPTFSDLQILVDAAGGIGNTNTGCGNALKAIGQDATSTNTSGFSGLLGGYRSHINGEFRYLATTASIWGSSLYDGTNVTGNGLSLHEDNDNISFYNHNYDLKIGYNIRCLKD